MDVASACALPVGSIVWQTWSGAVVLTVVAKASYLLRSVESRLAEKQDPIIAADRTWYDDPREALWLANDLVPYKRRAEVVVVGHAQAPHGVPVRSLRARLSVAGIDKSIEIFPDRIFSHTGQMREGSPFAKVPLRWQHAAGGPGTPNPIGIWRDAPPDPYGQRLAPRFQPPGLRVTSPSDPIPTLGFGPIAPTWPDRIAKLHHHAHTWDPRRWHERPLPKEIDAGFFNAAPPDQQVDTIRADARIELENLHPDLSHLTTHLAPVVPEAIVERPGRPEEVVPFVCDTMWIDADRGVCTLTWRARIILEGRHAPGVVRVAATGAPPPEEAAPVAASSAVQPPAPSASPSVHGTAASPPVAAPTAAPRMESPAPPQSPPPPQWKPGHPVERFPIEHCAIIAASFARSPADGAKTLERYGISEDDWDAIEGYWTQVLKKDAAEYEDRRLWVYDRAFVMRLEELRGPITPEEYARLTLAQARDKGALTRALRDLGLPWGASQRIQRVYDERMVANPHLAAAVRAAMSE